MGGMVSAFHAAENDYSYSSVRHFALRLPGPEIPRPLTRRPGPLACFVVASSRRCRRTGAIRYVEHQTSAPRVVRIALASWGRRVLALDKASAAPACRPDEGQQLGLVGCQVRVHAGSRRGCGLVGGARGIMTMGLPWWRRRAHVARELEAGMRDLESSRMQSGLMSAVLRASTPPWRWRPRSLERKHAPGTCARERVVDTNTSGAPTALRQQRWRRRGARAPLDAQVPRCNRCTGSDQDHLTATEHRSPAILTGAREAGRSSSPRLAVADYLVHADARMHALFSRSTGIGARPSACRYIQQRQQSAARSGCPSQDLAIGADPGRDGNCTLHLLDHDRRHGKVVVPARP